MQNTCNSLKKLTNKMTETVDELFKKIDKNLDYTGTDSEIITSIVKEMKNHSYALKHVLLTLRQQEIQKTANNLLTSDIKSSIQDKSKILLNTEK
ncbi:hypothetical protein MXB_3819 [Myxobolus squamalis]|nr:hypothetical protein MXB_3819 [Myxobolus squamalis]